MVVVCICYIWIVLLCFCGVVVFRLVLRCCFCLSVFGVCFGGGCVLSFYVCYTLGGCVVAFGEWVWL